MSPFLPDATQHLPNEILYEVLRISRNGTPISEEQTNRIRNQSVCRLWKDMSHGGNSYFINTTQRMRKLNEILKRDSPKRVKVMGITIDDNEVIDRNSGTYFRLELLRLSCMCATLTRLELDLKFKLGQGNDFIRDFIVLIPLSMLRMEVFELKFDNGSDGPVKVDMSVYEKYII